MSYLTFSAFTGSLGFMSLTPPSENKVLPGENKSRTEISPLIIRVCGYTDDSAEKLQRNAYSFEGAYANKCADAVDSALKKYAADFERCKSPRLMRPEFMEPLLFNRDAKITSEVRQANFDALALKIYNGKSVLRKNHPNRIKNQEDSAIDRAGHIQDIKDYLVRKANWENATPDVVFPYRYTHAGTLYHNQLGNKQQRDVILTQVVEQAIVRHGMERLDSIPSSLSVTQYQAAIDTEMNLLRREAAKTSPEEHKQPSEESLLNKARIILRAKLIYESIPAFRNDPDKREAFLEVLQVYLNEKYNGKVAADNRRKSVGDNRRMSIAPAPDSLPDQPVGAFFQESKRNLFPELKRARSVSQIATSKTGKPIFSLRTEFFNQMDMQALVPAPTFINTIGPSLFTISPNLLRAHVGETKLWAPVHGIGTVMEFALRLPDMLVGPIFRGISRATSWVGNQLLNTTLNFDNWKPGWSPRSWLPSVNPNRSLLNPLFYLGIVTGLVFKGVAALSVGVEALIFSVAKIGSFRPFSLPSSKADAVTTVEQKYSVPPRSQSRRNLTVKIDEVNDLKSPTASATSTPNFTPSTLPGMTESPSYNPSSSSSYNPTSSPSVNPTASPSAVVVDVSQAPIASTAPITVNSDSVRSSSVQFIMGKLEAVIDPNVLASTSDAIQELAPLPRSAPRRIPESNRRSSAGPSTENKIESRAPLSLPPRGKASSSLSPMRSTPGSSALASGKSAAERDGRRTTLNMYSNARAMLDESGSVAHSRRRYTINATSPKVDRKDEADTSSSPVIDRRETGSGRLKR